ncbi:M48 family metallopeptidase [Apibacter sp. wkB309]|uniref:tetratricopeptide repeat protein n=1 Tax=Apibacter sp. wkB309 TaxID=1679467 RepID=UPI000CFA5ABF|nr:CDC27 family protein [Apibacter sp. wkB309]PQL91353.1 hypothetical protein C4S75_04500 [Apibacter sp. wkB309]
MNKKNLKKIIEQCKHYEEYGKFTDCLTILHHLTNQYPKVSYFYYLAQVYYKNKNPDLTLKFINEALHTQPKHKKSWFLIKGVFYEDQGKLNEAEQMYLKALDIDYDHFDSRIQLISLYFYKYKDYQETIKQCEFVFSYKKFEYTKKKKCRTSFMWLYALWNPLYKSYIYSHQYKQAIKVINHKKQTINFMSVEIKEDFFRKDDKILFKLYYLLNDKKKLDEITYLWKHYYKVSDNYIKGMKLDAEQNYITHINPKNYDSDIF